MRSKLITLIIIILCGETIILSSINWNLNKKVKKFEFLFYESLNIDMREGSTIPNFSDIELIDLKSGDVQKFLDILDTQGALLFIFSTDCYSCDEIAEIWNKLYENYKMKWIVFGISKNFRTITENYKYRNRIEFPVYLIKDLSDIDNFPSTPYTLLIGKQGNILKSIYGISNELKKLNLKEVSK